MCRNTTQIHGKWTLQLNKKTMLKNIAQRNKKPSKHDSQLGPTKWRDFRSGASWDTFGRPNHFWASKTVPPALPKCFQWLTNKVKMTPESSPIAKKITESQAFSEPDRADSAKRLQYFQYGQACGPKRCGTGFWVPAIGFPTAGPCRFPEGGYWFQKGTLMTEPWVPIYLHLLNINWH